MPSFFRCRCKYGLILEWASTAQHDVTISARQSHFRFFFTRLENFSGVREFLHAKKFNYTNNIIYCHWIELAQMKIFYDIHQGTCDTVDKLKFRAHQDNVLKSGSTIVLRQYYNIARKKEENWTINLSLTVFWTDLSWFYEIYCQILELFFSLYHIHPSYGTHTQHQRLATIQPIITFGIEVISRQKKEWTSEKEKKNRNSK